MRRLQSAPVWFAITAVLIILTLFVVDGVVGGLVALAAVGALLFACIRALTGQKVDDRTALVGWFGGYF
jgi:hypothetical protein